MMYHQISSSVRVLGIGAAIAPRQNETGGGGV
jgi:hypothetical protein